ncbi:hypothetical protein AQUCO_00700635v1 [Aquilegia coerulea]|uniref:EF-hand domain-containing protein n=1 Tax=Aquilegia coerulea TaxID=218851 RepID=A0A2G5EL03_AQUCA|nr:hypothetical protein AQUCO_00700635v1 [Aquilegia coerulea]
MTFCVYTRVKKKTMTVEDFKTWLKQFDADGDGRISKNELRTAIRDLGMCFTTWKARKGVRIADANGNGFLDENEIEGLVEFAKNKLGMKIQG